MNATYAVRWSSRVLALAVLVALVLAAVAIVVAGQGAAAWSWFFLGAFLVAAVLASIANFGDRWTVDDAGITYRNVLLQRTPLARLAPERHAAWQDVHSAQEAEGKTWFLQVEGQKRWILDHLDAHEHLRLVLQDRGVPVSSRTRPRIFRLPGQQG